MALSATVFHLTVELADIDRGVYETLDLHVAREPSETAEYMLMRVLAYALEYRPGIAFTGGVASGDEPAVLVRDDTGRITAWIEVGLPDAGRLHRGRKLAGRAAVYTHRNVSQVLAHLSGAGVHMASDIPIYALPREVIAEIATAIQRRSTVSLSITERELYVEVEGRTWSTPIVEHRVA